MKIVDVFPFFNELDLLEIRLNVLDPYVDLFIISEATKTFSGLDKPLGLTLLEPHINYTNHVFKVLEKNIEIKGIAHITGGGLTENIPRILPDNCSVKIKNWDKALKAALKAKKIFPTKTYIDYLISGCLIKLGKRNEAIYFFQNAKKIKEVPNRLAKNFPELVNEDIFLL